MTSTATSLWRFSKTINDCLDRILQPIIRRYGLTVTQAQLLCSVRKSGSSTVGAIAKTLGLACTNTSAMCKKLSQMGFLHRKRRENDKRIVSIMLTDEGQDAAREIEVYMDRIYASQKKNPNLKELENLMDSLVAFSNDCQKELKE